MSMYVSISDHLAAPAITFLADPPRDDWNFEVKFGTSRRILYISYEELKSAWFAIGAALSDFEDNQPIDLLPVPPAVAEFVSHGETLYEPRPKIDGDFPLGQSECLRENGKHEWRWGIRSIAGDRAVTRRYCVRCGTYFAGGRP